MCGYIAHEHAERRRISLLCKREGSQCACSTPHSEAPNDLYDTLRAACVVLSCENDDVMSTWHKADRCVPRWNRGSTTKTSSRLSAHPSAYYCYCITEFGINTPRSGEVPTAESAVIRCHQKKHRKSIGLVSTSLGKEQKITTEVPEAQQRKNETLSRTGPRPLQSQVFEFRSGP